MSYAPPSYESAPFSSLAPAPRQHEQMTGSNRTTHPEAGAPLAQRDTRTSEYSQETLGGFWGDSEANRLDYSTVANANADEMSRASSGDNGDLAYYAALAKKEAAEKAEKKRLKALGTPKGEIDSLVRGPAINSSKYLLPGFGLTEERFRRIISEANSAISSIRPQDRANGKNGVSIMIEAFAAELIARGRGELRLVDDDSKAMSIRFTMEGKVTVKKVEDLMRGQFSLERVDSQ